MKSGERISILILRERTAESWSLRVPLRLFRFLMVISMLLVILAGFAVTWLGAISVRLQTADALAAENQKLLADLKRTAQLEDELRMMEEQQKRVLALTQAFLDDSARTNPTTQAVEGLYDDRARARVVQSFLTWIERSSEHRATLSRPIQPLLLRSPVETWALGAEAALGYDSLSTQSVLVEPDIPVRAPADGLIVSAQWDPLLGLVAEIATPEGYRIRLGKLGELDVQAGDFVHKGSPIGRTGPGSGVDPVRLSIQVIVNGLAIDPLFAMMR